MTRFTGFLFSLFLFGLGYSSTAQAQKLEYSSQEIDSYTYDYLRIGGYSDNGFFLFQSNLPFDTDRDRVGLKSRKLKITFYNNNLTIGWVKKFDKTSDSEKLENIFVINGKAALVKSYFTGGEGKLAMRIYMLNEQGDEIKPGVEIGSVSFNTSSELYKIKVISSLHNTCYGFIQNEKKKDGTQAVHGIVTGNDLKALRTFDFDVPYPEKDFYYDNWLLTDSADFVLEGSYTSRENNPNRRRWDAYKVFASVKNANEVKEYAINSSETELNGSKLGYDALQNKLVIAGFYNEKNSSKSGIVYASLELTGYDSLRIFRQPINDVTLLKMLAGSSPGRNGSDISNLNVEKIVLRNDGGAVLLAEASYVSDYSYYDYFTQSYIRNSEFHFENAIVLSVNADGTIDWDAVLRKEQISTNDNGRYSSFAVAQTESNIHLIYNTRLEKNNRMSLFTVNKNGTSSETEIAKAEDRILMIPTGSKQISANAIALPCWNRKKLVMAKLTF